MESNQVFVEMSVMSKRYILMSWQLLSTTCLLVSIVYSAVAADTGDSTKSVNDLLASSSSESDLSDLTIQPDSQLQASSNSSSSNTSEGSGLLAAPDCQSFDLPSVCGGRQCSRLPGYCIHCDFNESCVYGESHLTAACWPREGVNCSVLLANGSLSWTVSQHQNFTREYECRYCYQLVEPEKYWCNKSTSCALNKPSSHYPALPRVLSTCWTRPEYLCLGQRCYYKQTECNWSKGYKWSTTMLLSIFLGGFGADRFYLGFWEEGIGKLLSFGGLGVWTLVDVILIAVGYIGPHDGSVYIM